MTRRLLLDIDAVINLLLGLGLMAFPGWLVATLGIPESTESFYRLLLGAVLFGIGVALLVERFRDAVGSVGLGLGGAIAINLCGAIAVAAWLISRADVLPVRGRVVLWCLVVVLIALSSLELASEIRSKVDGERHKQAAAADAEPPLRSG